MYYVVQGSDDTSDRQNCNAGKVGKTSANHYSVRINEISFVMYMSYSKVKTNDDISFAS